MRGLLAKRKEESQCDSVPHGKRQGNIRAITAYEKKEGGNQSESQDRARSHHPIGHIVVKGPEAGVEDITMEWKAITAPRYGSVSPTVGPHLRSRTGTFRARRVCVIATPKSRPHPDQAKVPLGQE